MPGVLVIAEHVRGQVRAVTRELVTAGVELRSAGGGPLMVAVIGAGAARLAAEVDLDGVDEVLQVPVDEDEFVADVYRQACEALVRERDPAVTLAGFTVNGMSYAPALAAGLGMGFASDVIAAGHVEGELVAYRDLYGGKVQAELDFPGKRNVLLLLRPTAWQAAERPGAARMTSFAAAIDRSRVRSRHLEFRDPPAADVDITTADFLLSVGRGVGERKNLEQLERLAERMGATLAVSRPLVDAGWMPAARQVGQSGRTVKPRVYLALGISGAVQHLAGMKASGTIIAVNSDPDAPIFGVAHYGVVADLFDVAEELEKLS
ncbi:MAG: electron transfer flavoprotein subunit alpha/FixB family protein [Gaiellales bacterium]